jgi:hypothetical protein
MATRDDELRALPGRVHHGDSHAKRPQTFVDEVMRAAKRAGIPAKLSAARARWRPSLARRRRVALFLSSRSLRRRVTIITRRIMRHQGQAVCSAECKYVAATAGGE